jgi:hypothetical protein
MDQWWNGDYQSKTEEFGDKPAPVQLCLPQIMLDVARG